MVRTYICVECKEPFEEEEDNGDELPPILCPSCLEKFRESVNS